MLSLISWAFSLHEPGKSAFGLDLARLTLGCATTSYDSFCPTFHRPDKLEADCATDWAWVILQPFSVCERDWTTGHGRRRKQVHDEQRQD